MDPRTIVDNNNGYLIQTNAYPKNEEAKLIEKKAKAIQLSKEEN